MSNITVENLHFSYTAGKEILKGINLEFDNTSTAIIGQNGSGKTTFVKLLKGLLRPSSGRILVSGTDIADYTVAKLSRQIGMVFQNPNDQIFKSTVMDEVMFGPLNIGQSESSAKENSLRALEMVGLAHCLEAHPYDLSLSERKLVSIASVVAMQTEVVIFDEPTIAQDFTGKEKIKKIIQDLSAEGRLVLTIIHDMDFVAETFERTVVFQKGQVLLDGDTRSVFGATEVLYSAYLEPPHVTQLCQKLGYPETFLTPEEFIRYKKKQNG
jgi:energy-coupling factor transport system ATP-binding protein